MGVRHLERLARRVRAAASVRALSIRLLWLTVIPILRRRARGSLDSLSDGVTVVTVTWNSSRQLAVLLDLVRRRSPPDVRIIVVDNASRDDTAALLAGRSDVRVVRLPFNIGHELAMDIGFLLARTTVVVALDVDAFPIEDRWLPELLAALEEPGIQVAGARLNREYVHPCCLAIRTARFVERRHSFRSHYVPRAAGRDASGDVGESISAGEPDGVRFFDPTSTRGPGDVGTVFGDIVYHNFYATRFKATQADVLDEGVTGDAAESAWDEAVARYA